MWNLTKKIAFFFALGFSGCHPVHAEDPPANALHMFLDFKQSKGLMDYYPSDNIGDENAQSLNNLDWSLSGDLQTRKGSQLIARVVNNELPARSGLKYFWIHTSTTNTKYFLMKTDGFIYFMPINNQQAATTLAGDFLGKLDFLNVNGIGYMVSDSTRILRVNEITSNQLLQLVAVPNTETATIVKTHLDRMVVAGSTNSGNDLTLFFSSSTDFDKWPPENFVDLNSEAGNERITCIGDQLFGNLPIYTNKTTRLATGTEYPDADNDSPGNIVFKTISQTIGCAEQRTLKTIRNKQLFYSDGQNGSYPGIYEFNGVTVKERTVSYRRFFKEFVVLGSTFPGPIAFAYNDTYCLMVSTKGGIKGDNGNGYNDATNMICIDENDRIISNRPTNVGMFATDFSTAYFAHTVIRAGGAGLNNIYVYNASTSTTDEGLSQSTRFVYDPIQWSYKSKDFGMSDKNNVRSKVPERAYIKYKKNPGTMTVRANYDFGNSSTTWTIDMSSFYKTGDKLTVMTSTADVTTRLRFPSSTRFNFINFEMFGSSRAAIDFIDFYATPEPLR